MRKSKVVSRRTPKPRGTPITARDIEALNAHRDELERQEAVLKDPKFQELWRIYQTLTPDAQRLVERKANYFANQSTRRLRLVVDNTR